MWRISDYVSELNITTIQEAQIYTKDGMDVGGQCVLIMQAGEGMSCVQSCLGNDEVLVLVNGPSAIVLSRQPHWET